MHIHNLLTCLVYVCPRIISEQFTHYLIAVLLEYMCCLCIYIHSICFLFWSTANNPSSLCTHTCMHRIVIPIVFVGVTNTIYCMNIWLDTLTSLGGIQKERGLRIFFTKTHTHNCAYHDFKNCWLLSLSLWCIHFISPQIHRCLRFHW